MEAMRKEIGFTLVEVLFALMVGLALLGAIYITMISGYKSSMSLEKKIVLQQGARAALETMVTEISMASYNPNFFSSIWRDPANCRDVSPNQAYKGMQAATADEIILQMDTNDNGGIENVPSEQVAYAYDIPNQRMTRSANCGTPISFLGDVPGNPRSERVINNTLHIPVFRYFDGMGNEIPAENLPTDIPNIRRVQITLAVETEDRDPNSFQRRRMTYSTSVILRNHATTL